jgi:hypothetical protein
MAEHLPMDCLVEHTPERQSTGADYMRNMEHEVAAAGFRSFVSFFSCVVNLHRLITRVDKASAQ